MLQENFKKMNKKIEEEIRNGFNMNRDETDQIAIGYLLSKGEEQLHFLKSGSSNVFPKNKARDADVSTNDTWVGKGPEDDKYKGWDRVAMGTIIIELYEISYHIISYVHI